MLAEYRRRKLITDVDGVKVKDLRTARHWTQAQTGERAGICESLVRFIERGRGSIRRKTLDGLGRAFEVEPDSLRLGRELIKIPRRRVADMETEKLEEILDRSQRTMRIVLRELQRRGEGVEI